MPSAIKEVDLLRTHETKNGFGRYRSFNDGTLLAIAGAPTIIRTGPGPSAYQFRVGGAGSAVIRSKGSMGPALLDSRVHLRLWAHAIVDVLGNASGTIEITPSLGLGYRVIEPGVAVPIFGATVSVELTGTGNFWVTQPFPVDVHSPDESQLLGHAANPMLYGQVIITTGGGGDAVKLLDMYWEAEAKETVINDG